MDNQTMRDILNRPFPTEAIELRKGAAGKQFAYLKTPTVIARLDEATDGTWDFAVKQMEWREDVLIVVGELTIPGLGTRAGIGVQEVKANAGEDLIKGAASDALKKAATLFGVGLNLCLGSGARPSVAAANAPRTGGGGAASVLNETGHQCAHCKAPDGKPHVRTCPALASRAA